MTEYYVEYRVRSGGSTFRYERQKCSDLASVGDFLLNYFDSNEFWVEFFLRETSYKEAKGLSNDVIEQTQAYKDFVDETEPQRYVDFCLDESYCNVYHSNNDWQNALSRFDVLRVVTYTHLMQQYRSLKKSAEQWLSTFTTDRKWDELVKLQAKIADVLYGADVARGLADVIFHNQPPSGEAA